MDTLADYSAWKAKQQQNDVEAANVVIGGVDVKPDEAAADLNLADEFAKTTGNPAPPAPMVKEFRGVFQQAVEREKNRAILSGSPRLTEWLRNPENTAVARDDLSGLSWWETPLAAAGNALSRGVQRVPQSWNQFLANSAAQRDQDKQKDFGSILADETAIRGGAGNVIAAKPIAGPQDLLAAGSRFLTSRLSSLFGDDEKAAAAYYEQQVGLINKRIAETALSPAGARGRQNWQDVVPSGDVMTDLRSYINAVAKAPGDFAAFVGETAAESLPAVAAAAGVTMATRSPAAGAVFMGANSAMTEAGTTPADVFKDKGIDISTPEGAARAVNDPDLMREAINRGNARAVVVGLMDGLSGGVAGTMLAKSHIGNMVLQGITQAAMGAAGEAGGQAASGQTFNLGDILMEGLAEFASAPVEVAGMGGGRLFERAAKAKAAGDRVALFQELSGQAQSSILRARMPEKFRQFVAAATANGPVENVYVPADQFVQYFQGLGVDPHALADTLDGVTRDDLDAALAGGGDLQIPTATYAAKIAGSEHDAFLMENMRFDPSEFTAREAAEFNAHAQDAMQEAYEVAEQVRQDQEQFRSHEQEIYDTMVSRLREAGRSTDVATTEAMLYPAFYRVMAERSGMAIDEFMQKYPLPQVRGDLPEGMQLKNVDSLTRTLAEARNRKAAGLDKRQTLLEFISEHGGINDVGGELKARDAEVVKRGKGKKALKLARAGAGAAVRDMLGGDNGKKHSADEVARAAIEAGFMADDPVVHEYQEAVREGREVPDITRTLWDHIDRELGGEPVRAGEADAATARAADLDQMEAYLHGLGLSLQDDDAAIRAAIEKDQAGGGREFAQFAGPQAETADLHQLSRAKDMATKGSSAATIRNETGWSRGVDGRWRYEISDDDATLDVGLVPELGPQSNAVDAVALGDLLQHEKLFAAYPELQTVLVSFDPKLEARGQANAASGEVILNPRQFENADGVLSTLMHEVQHLIQTREGFARGGNLSMSSKVKDVLDMLASRRHFEVSEWKDAHKAVLDDVEKAALMNGYVQLYASFEQLINYANSDKPSSVLRHIGGNTSWFYSPYIQQNDALRLRANDLQRRFYAMPKRHRMKERNTFLRDMSFDMAQLLRDAVPSEIWSEFKADERQTRSMLSAYEREAARARKRLKPLREKEGNARRAKEVADATKFKTPFETYQALAGEVEARNTQARLKMTDAERAATAPETTADVHRSETVVIFQDGEVDAPFMANINDPRPAVGTDRRLLFQSGPVAGPRGAIQFPAAGVGNGETVIRMFEGADLSTLIHESGHYFLTVMQDMAARDAATGGAVSNSARDMSAEREASEFGSDLHRALSSVVMPGWDAGKAAVDAQWAIDNGRTDIAQAIVDRASERANLPVGKPGVAATSPRYAEIEANLNAIHRQDVEDARRIADVTGLAPSQTKASAPLTGPAADYAAVKNWWRENAADVAKDAKRVMPDVEVTADDVIAALDHGTTGDVMKDGAIDVGMQEQFARGFEAYLMEGKAPSVELRTAFEKFRSWLISVYRRLAGLNVTISDDIRGVFDRMIATDDEIAKASAETGGADATFTTAEQLGLSPEQFDNLMKLRAQSEDEAKARLLRETMAPVKRAQEKWFKEERAKVRDEVATRINTAPTFRAIEWMGNRRWFGEEQPADMPDMRLSKEMLVDRYGEGILATLPRGKQTIYAVEGGFDPDEAAGWFGFGSGDEMVRAMERAPKRSEAIDAETDRVMRDRHGDVLNDGEIEAAALDAVHNDKRGQWIAAELKAITDVVQAGKPMTAKEARASARGTIARTRVRDAMNANRFLAAERKAADEAARIGAMLARDGVWLRQATARMEAKARSAAKGGANVDQVNAAIDRRNNILESGDTAFTVPDRTVQTKAGAKVIAGGDRTAHVAGYNENVAKLIEAKRRQLLNHAFYMEARKVADEVEKAERFVNKLEKASHRERIAGAGRRENAQVDYLGAIDEILERYDFRRLSGRAEQRRGALNAYVAAMTAAGRDNELAIPESVLADAARKPYKTMPVEEMRGVVDTLKNLEHTALRWDDLIDRENKRKLDEVVTDIVAAFDANVKKKPPSRVATGGERRRHAVRQFFDLVLNATTLLREIDGFKDGGAAYRNIKGPIDEAMNRLIVRKEKAAHDLEALYSIYSKDERRKMTVREHMPALGYALSKWERIAVALNTGNDGNLQRLTDPRVRGSLTPDQVKAVLATLDERDANFVQSVWDYVGSFRADIASRERRATGVEPGWVEGTPVEIGGKVLSGGYFPLKYDPRLSAAGRDNEAADITQSLQAGRFGKAQTRNGHTKARAQSSGQAVQLDMSVMHRHVNQVIYDLELSEAVANGWRILQDGRVRSSFIDAGKQADFDALEIWLQDVGTGELKSADFMGRAARILKSNFTAAKLAFNLSTVMMQVVGTMQSAVVVGKKNMAIGIAKTVANPAGVAADVAAKSPFMASRQTTFNKDIYDFYSDPITGPVASRWGDIKSNYIGPLSFWLMTKVQFYTADVPTWIAGYQQGLKKFGNDEAKAIAHADDIVKRSQASGLFSDRSAIERGSVTRNARQNDVVRLFTTLASYMFAKFNVAYERSATAKRTIAEEGVSFNSAKEALSWTLDMAFLFTLEAVLTAAIKGQLPKGDDDDDGWLKFLAKQTGLSVMSTIPFVRDAGSSLSGFNGGGAYGAVTEEFMKPLKQAAQGDVDKALVKSIIGATGLATGLPATQINRAVDAQWRAHDGEDVSPLEYILGRFKK